MLKYFDFFLKELYIIEVFDADDLDRGVLDTRVG